MRIARQVTSEERQLLRAMATDAASKEIERKRARAVLTFLETASLTAASEAASLSEATVRKWVQLFDEQGWQALLVVPQPRGGDFLARYDQGFWAERLVRGYLERDRSHRPIPYGTSRSEPFTDMETFRDYAIGEFMLQAWSASERWKRPDLLVLPRSVLREQGGTDEWTPDLIHWDNERCTPFLESATVGVEVETSLWMVSRATVDLSFTVKEEDLAALRNWRRTSMVPLYIIQVFFDSAYALPFGTLEYLISEDAPPNRRVAPEVDRTTGKATFMVPLGEGVLLGRIPEPDVEGRVFKSDNGRVTVYGRLVGSTIIPEDEGMLYRLAKGGL